MRLIESLLATVLILSLLVFAVVWAVGLVIDPTDNTDEAIRAADVSLESAAMNHLVEALSTTSDSGKAEIHLDEYDINELLYAISGELNFGDFYARSMYIEQQKVGYRLCVPISFSGINTLLSANFDMFTEDDLIIFRLRDICVAKTQIGSGILSMFNIAERITSALHSFGIESTYVADVLTVKLTRENIGDLLMRGIKDDPNAALVAAFYNILMVKTDAAIIDIKNPLDLTIGIDFADFGGSKNDALTSVNSYTADLLDRGVIGKDNISLVSKYYLNGYMNLEKDEQSAILSLLKDEQSEAQTILYGGIIERESFSLATVLVDQLYGGLDSFTPGFKIYDHNINAMLSELALIGTVWQFADSDNNCAYLAIADLRLTIDDDYIRVFLDIDINGYLLSVSVDFATGTSPLASITGTLGNIYIGDLALDSEDVELMFDFLADNLSADWLYTDKAAKQLTLDFTSTFEGNFVLETIISSSKSITTSCKKSAMGGYVNMLFNLLG